MNTETLLKVKIGQMPQNLKEELLHYAEYLIEKKVISVNKKQPEPGFMKGFVKYMADDFDAPLEDFKEYAE